MSDVSFRGLCLKYFVLNPNKNDAYGEASRKAIKAYSRSIQKENPDLAEDLSVWIGGIEAGLQEEAGE